MTSGTDILIQHLTNARGQRLAAVGSAHVTDACILDYVEGSLDVTAQQRVRAHLSECGDCKKAVLLLRAHRALQSSVVVESPSSRSEFPRQPVWLQAWGWICGHRAYVASAMTVAIALMTAAILFAPVDQQPQLADASKSDGAVAPIVVIPPPNSAPAIESEGPGAAPGPASARTTETTAPVAVISRDPKSPDAPTSLPPLNAEHLFAVVIANADYSAVRLPPAPYALNDADGVLRWLGAFGVPSERTIFLENASSARLNEVFGSQGHTAGILSQSIDTDTDVLVYYSGHAVPDLNTHRPYLLPVDADPNYAALSGYALETLLNNVSQLNARSVTVVLETSFAGSSENAALFHGISPGLVDVIIPQSVPDRVTVLAGADRGQVNNADPATRRHVFTNSLLRALQGAADSNGDRAMSASEVARFVQREVTEHARRGGAEQTPWVRGLAERTLATKR